MNDQSKIIVFLCVVIMTIGQVLFKQVALNYNKTGSLFNYEVLGILSIAVFLYAASTIMWVWALRTTEITKAYPFFALGFVFVPLFSAWIFGESLSSRYSIGVFFIVLGVTLTSMKQ